MSRYIDADALAEKQWWVEIQGENLDDIAEQIIGQCKDIVKTAPSIEIVRCKECKHWRNTDAEQIPTASIMCGHMHPDDFCSYGEREGE